MNAEGERQNGQSAVEVRLRRLEKDLDDLEKQNNERAHALEKQINDKSNDAAARIRELEKQVTDRTNSQYRAALIFLWSMLAALVGIVWSNLEVISRSQGQ